MTDKPVTWLRAFYRVRYIVHQITMIAINLSCATIVILVAYAVCILAWAASDRAYRLLSAGQEERGRQ